MKYAALIYTSEQEQAKASPEDMQAIMGKYFAFTNEIKEKGVYLGGEPLQPIATATTVRVRNGKTSTTDGPFAETKEQLGGFYLFECRNLDEAVEYAAKIPGAAHGCIEVRPIMSF